VWSAALIRTQSLSPDGVENKTVQPVEARRAVCRGGRRLATSFRRAAAHAAGECGEGQWGRRRDGR